MSKKFVKKSLYCPNVNDLIKILQSRLEKSFRKVEVKLVDCPDLTKPPFHLLSEGLCGDTSIADIGGVPYLIPIPDHQKIYDLKAISHDMDYMQCNMIGAGAAPSHTIGNLAELILNLSINKAGCVVNNSHIAQINKQSNTYEVKRFSASCEAKHLVNVYTSLGNPGKVIEIKASNRMSKEGFVECLQNILFEKYLQQHNDTTESCIGLGGVFLLQSGAAKIHIMPDYTKESLLNMEMMNNWLRFFEMAAPLICLGYLVSHDPGLNLRKEHFHCFNMNGSGGHFHHDVTPSDASYLAYFNLPEFLYRFDMPHVPS